MIASKPIAKFTVREELRDVLGNSEDTCRLLHEKMKEENFIDCSKIIVLFELPTGEYKHDSTLATEDVKNQVVSIVNKIWQNFSVLVTKSTGSRSIHNLKEFKQ